MEATFRILHVALGLLRVVESVFVFSLAERTLSLVGLLESLLHLFGCALRHLAILFGLLLHPASHVVRLVKRFIELVSKLFALCVFLPVIRLLSFVADTFPLFLLGELLELTFGLFLALQHLGHFLGHLLHLLLTVLLLLFFLILLLGERHHGRGLPALLVLHGLNQAPGFRHLVERLFARSQAVLSAVVLEIPVRILER